MPIKCFAFIPKNVREWGNYLRDAEVTPSDGSITDNQFADREGLSVIGRAQSTAGAPGDITAGADNRFLARKAGVLAFSAIADSDLPSTIARDSEVTTAANAAQSAAEATAASALSAHVAAADPHPGYTTAAELVAAIAAHTSSSDNVTDADLTAAIAAIAPVVTTVGSLPASSTNDRRYFVTDATAPTFLGALTGGGAVVTPVFWNGTAWVAG